jgi:hypothetical protein
MTAKPPADFLDAFRANMRRLDACTAPAHDFVRDGLAHHARRYRCKHCGGAVSALERGMYVRGLLAGRAAAARGGLH